jgi:hypothetical protein
VQARVRELREERLDEQASSIPLFFISFSSAGTSFAGLSVILLGRVFLLAKGLRVRGGSAW